MSALAMKLSTQRSLLHNQPDAHQGTPLFALGFRPFFLLAGLSATALIPGWLALLFTGARWPSPLPPPLWHAHEMLFGYTSAVIAGFLLTAVQNWTGRATARGALLGALALLWIAGRAVSAAGQALPPWLAAAIDLAFLPALAACIARPIAATRNRRNAAMPVMVLVLAGANGLYWWGALGGEPLMMLRGQRVALDVIALLILVVGGRIIPGFTANAVDGLKTRARSALDYAGIAAMVSVVVADLIDPSSRAVAYCAAIAALTNGARLWGWGGTRTFARPILLVLHSGFAFTAAALGLRAWALLSGALPESAATHLLTVGGIGLMTLGMMARVALGHTGRPLALAPSIVVALYLLGASALVRVVGPLALPTRYTALLWIAGALWTLAFALFTARYTPILLAPRPDGRPG
jgi:uncharacterized protein involved in response to NO